MTAFFFLPLAILGRIIPLESCVAFGPLLTMHELCCSVQLEQTTCYWAKEKGKFTADVSNGLNNYLFQLLPGANICCVT